MALIFLDSSTCSLCNNVLKSDDDVLGFASFLTSDHKFWQYSDTGMHKTCFEQWEHKDEFENLYAEVMSSR